MLASRKFTTWFNGLSVIGQSCLIVAAAVAGSNLLTLIFYSIFFAERLLLDLLLTTLIVLVVASPLTVFFISRSARLAELAAELDRANRVDDLTGLLNRKTFLAEARRLLARGDGHGATGTMLFIDADHFKALNDTFGHAMGDAVLREIGAVLGSCVRDSDLVGRLGGEEFALFIEGADRDRAARICERIQERVKRISGLLDLGTRSVTVSIGAAMQRPGQDIDSLLVAADRNLYCAKANGRDRVVHTEPDRAAA